MNLLKNRPFWRYRETFPLLFCSVYLNRVFRTTRYSLFFLMVSSIFLGCANLSSQGPNFPSQDVGRGLGPADISAKHLEDGGILLSIRKHDQIASVMLLVAISDSGKKVPTLYTLASDTESSYMTGERRLVNGAVVNGRFFLVDSSAQADNGSGEYFQIEIPKNPYYMETGTTRVDISEIEGLNIVVRTFEKKMGDYSGKYHDQLVVLSFKTKP